MRKRIKKGGFVIIFLLLIPLIFAEGQVVQVPQEQVAKKTGVFSSTFAFLKSPIFWWILIITVLIIAIFIGIFFLIRWLIKYFKQKNDIFCNIKAERIKLSKIQKRYPQSTHFLKVTKNVPIRLVRKEENGRLTISSPIAYHRGDYSSHEGNVIISMNLRDNKKFFFFPITSLLIIPNREKIEITQQDKKGKPITLVIDNLPKARDIVTFNDNEILIYAESLSNVGQFYVPVLKTKDGKIIDLSMPTFQTLKEVVLGNYLYQQTSDFGNLAKKSMEINPWIRSMVKTSDSNQNVDVPSQNNQPR